ncbi:MAG: TraM recognition domain-containing protein [Actinomycetota bacterium]|nr:TraM recognition domain-containing protein [Actinomycetota bacterium]
MIRSGTGLAADLIRAGIHHPAAPLIALVLIAVPVLFYRRVLSRSAQVRNRVRALRWRIRLRLRPGPGYASLPELVFRWGRLAALSHGRRARPGLPLRYRLIRPVTDYAVRLGRAQLGRRCLGRMEDQQLVIAAPRTGKSGYLADRLLDHPGPAITTSTRVDLYALTAGVRSRRGPVEIFNPQNIGGLASTFSWDILGPCRDLVMARRIAAWLTGATVSQGANLGNIEWFGAKAATALGVIMWAAAVSGRTITDVFGWVQLWNHDQALRVLADHPDSTPEMLAVAKRAFADNRTSGSIRDSMELSLAWAIVPQLADAVTPAPGRGFDVQRFLGQNGTLYLVAPGDEDSPVASVFAAFTSWVHWAAGLAGTNSPHGRLDPPLWLGLDEVSQICPINLPVLLADSAGKGIMITAVVHGVSQLQERWGEHGAATILATCGTKVILPGLSDSQTLESLSALCGSVVIGDDDTVPVVPPELIRALPDWRALVIRMNLSPCVVKIRPAWKRISFRLGRVPAMVPQPPRPPRAEVIPAPELAELDPVPDAFPLPGSPERAPWLTDRR